MNYSNVKRHHYANDDRMSFDPNISPRSMSIRTTEKRYDTQDLVINQIQREIDDLSVKEYDCDGMHGEIKDMEERIRSMTEEISEQNSQYRIMRERTLLDLARAQARLRAEQKHHDTIDAERKKYYLETADAELIMKNRHFKFIQTNDTLKDATLAYQNVKMDFDKLKKSAHLVVENKIQLKSAIDSLERQLDDKLANFKALKDKVTKQEVQLNNYTNIRDRIESESDGLERNQNGLERQIDDVENQIFSMSIDLNNLLSELQKSKNEAYSIKNDISALENKIVKKRNTLNENEELIREMTAKIDEERSCITKKEEFSRHLKAQEEQKNEIIEDKRKEAENYKLKIEQLKKFSMRAFEEMKEYVKLDRALAENFARGYENPSSGFRYESPAKVAFFAKTH